MKKLLFIVAIATLTFSKANAQKVKFGAKAGINFASLSIVDEDEDEDEDLGFDSRTSFHIGGFAEITLSETFSIQPELVYSSQGAKEEESAGDYKYKFTAKLNYLNLPIIAKYYVIEGLSLEVGPQISYLISAKSDVEISEYGETLSETVDSKDSYEDFDFAVAAGLGYKIENGLNFAVRYNIGLALSDESDIRNNVLQLSVGYSF